MHACRMPSAAVMRAPRSSTATELPRGALIRSASMLTKYPINSSVPSTSRPWYGEPITTSSWPVWRHSSSAHSASINWNRVHPWR
eukprot:1840373-Prymnesium_polylepis.1